MKNKYSKPHSLTTDTRLSHSHIFNNSVLNRTNLSTSSQAQNQLNQIEKNIQYSQIKESQFLQIKNTQLQEKVKKMKQKIENLQQNKKYLLGINEKYVHVINQYYRDLEAQQSSKNQKAHKQKNYKSRGLQQTGQQQNISGKLNDDQLSKIKNYHKNCFSNIDNQQGQFLKVFSNLQKNHRNLVKHCLVMQDEINNYKTQMANFNQIKAQLYAVNHTNVTDLIQELKESTHQNKQLKMENNRLNFQLQKSMNQCERLKKMNQKQVKASSSSNNEAEKLRCEINTVKQTSIDNQRQYQSRIYELNLKVEKLQTQLRREDSQVRRNYEKRKQIQIQQVQKVHQNCKLKQNISELLNYKKCSMLSLDRSFCVKSRNKSQSQKLNQ